MKQKIDPHSYRMLFILLWHCAYSMMRPVFYVFSTMIAICAWVYLTDQSDGHVALWIGLVQLSIYIFGVWKNWHSPARVYKLQEYLEMQMLWQYLLDNSNQLDRSEGDTTTISRRNQDVGFTITVKNMKLYRRGIIDYEPGWLPSLEMPRSYQIGWFMKSRSRWA